MLEYLIHGCGVYQNLFLFFIKNINESIAHIFVFFVPSLTISMPLWDSLF